MVIDTSAIVAILFGEPEADRFAKAIEQDPIRLKGDDFTKTDIVSARGS